MSDETTALWHHLIEDHGMGLSMLHGNPYNIHAALVVGGACDDPEWVKWKWGDPESITKAKTDERAAEVRREFGLD